MTRPAAPALGIDITARYGEIRAILFSGFGGLITAHRLDDEDVLQDLLLRLHQRNGTPSQFDPSRGTFAHYVHLNASCVVDNIIKHGRAACRLPAGGPAHSLDQADGPDVPADTDAVESERLTAEFTRFVARRPGREVDVALRCIPLLLAGHEVQDVARRVGLSKPAMREVQLFLQGELLAWQSAPSADTRRSRPPHALRARRRPLTAAA